MRYSFATSQFLHSFHPTVYHTFILISYNLFANFASLYSKIHSSASAKESHSQSPSSVGCTLHLTVDSLLEAG